MQQFSSLLSWRLFTAQHVLVVFPAIIRSSMTAVAASGFTFVSWWQSCCVRGRAGRPAKHAQCFGNGKIKGSALWTVGTSILFPRFGSLWLLSLPKTQTLPRWSAFYFSESRGDCSCRGVFCRSYEEPLQGRDNGAGASLE